MPRDALTMTSSAWRAGGRVPRETSVSCDIPRVARRQHDPQQQTHKRQVRACGSRSFVRYNRRTHNKTTFQQQTAHHAALQNLEHPCVTERVLFHTRQVEKLSNPLVVRTYKLGIHLRVHGLGSHVNKPVPTKKLNLKRETKQSVQAECTGIRFQPLQDSPPHATPNPRCRHSERAYLTEVLPYDVQRARPDQRSVTGLCNAELWHRAIQVHPLLTKQDTPLHERLDKINNPRHITRARRAHDKLTHPPMLCDPRDPYSPVATARSGVTDPVPSEACAFTPTATGTSRCVVVTTNLPPTTSMCTWSPALSSPCRIFSDRRSSTSCCTARRSGRAPRAGSNPMSMSRSFAACVSSTVISRSSIRSARRFTNRSTICNNSGLESCGKTMISSTRLRNSGLKCFFSSSFTFPRMRS